jgi:hypothetical protein
MPIGTGVQSRETSRNTGLVRFQGEARIQNNQGSTVKTKTKKNKLRSVLVGNQSYGLYIGETDATDVDIIKSKAVRLMNCRHVARWYGKTGGVTSLAAHGPCGPQAKDSRVGAPCNALVTGVVNVLDLTDEAIANFAKIEAV